MKFCLSIVLMICFLVNISGQDYLTKKTVPKKVKEKYNKAVKWSRAKEYNKAYKAFQKILQKTPQFVDADLMLAAIHYDRDEFAKAEQKYEEVLGYAADYRTRTLYEIALTELKQEKFEEAIHHLERFLEEEQKNKRLRVRAKNHIKTAKFKSYALKNPVPFHPEPLPGAINTPHREYLISLTAEEDRLVVTRRVGIQEDLYASEKIDGIWQDGIFLEDINTNLSEGAQTLSADGKMLVYTACNRKDGYGDCDLYVSYKSKDKWSTPKNIGGTINSKAWESQPTLSSDGNTLYFASNRAGGLGNKDIWVTFKQANGQWGRPKNLGDNINTSGSEQAPFIHADNQTLYFMSDEHPGMGAHDLFVARKKNDDTWGNPENLGYPINTVANEGALVVQLDGKRAYFARDRNIEQGVEGTIPNEDIYSFELHEAARPNAATYVKAKVYDAETRLLIDAQVEFVALRSQKVFAKTHTGTEGRFLICLPLGQSYALNVNKDTYLFHSENFALEEIRAQTTPYLLEIYLKKIPAPSSSLKEKVSQPIVLRNIFFETASAVLLKASLFELHKLFRLLDEHPDMKIQLNGHTDDVGSELDNLLLSENRAKAVYQFLIEKGISMERLNYKGFGESQPIDTNETEKGRQNNRRTEFEIIK